MRIESRKNQKRVIMNIEKRASDEAVLRELGERIGRLRLNRNQTQADLATEAGVSLSTLRRVEQGASSHTANLVRLLRALDLLDNLEALVPEPPVSPLQQLETRSKERQRASSRADRPQKKEPWTWGDEE